MPDPFPLSILNGVGDGRLPGSSPEFLVGDALRPSKVQNFTEIVLGAPPGYCPKKEH